MKCDKTNRRKTLDEFALEAEGNEEEANLSLFDLLCIGIGGTVGSGVFLHRCGGRPVLRAPREQLVPKSVVSVMSYEAPNSGDYRLCPDEYLKRAGKNAGAPSLRRRQLKTRSRLR